ncbi:hypothetical protein RF11_08208 [Thelohanellus kitauei]|uniref:Uncharacterized protein n=1 Tax=Thelohanellus kitauei TaxID=669202 RepID=A0A0C2NIH6_THEKT|nr:hypothetical protein RF11_08208 [Thelohanellus kitauei]
MTTISSLACLLSTRDNYRDIGDEGQLVILFFRREGFSPCQLQNSELFNNDLIDRLKEFLQANPSHVNLIKEEINNYLRLSDGSLGSVKEHVQQKINRTWNMVELANN